MYYPTEPRWLSWLERQQSDALIELLKVPSLNPATATDKNDDGFFGV